MMEYLLAFAFAMFLSTVVVPFFMRYCCAFCLIYEPNEERKIYTESIPSCGGLGIIRGFFLASTYWLYFSQEILTLGCATAIIVIFGHLDDSRDLNYHWTFAGQILAIVVLISVGIFFVEVPFLGMGAAPWNISYPFILFLVLGVTNAVNLSDGLVPGLARKRGGLKPRQRKASNPKREPSRQVPGLVACDRMGQVTDAMLNHISAYELYHQLNNRIESQTPLVADAHQALGLTTFRPNRADWLLIG